MRLPTSRTISNALFALAIITLAITVLMIARLNKISTFGPLLEDEWELGQSLGAAIPLMFIAGITLSLISGIFESLSRRRGGRTRRHVSS